MNKYYTLSVAGNDAEIYIFGEILVPAIKDRFGGDADVSGYDLAQELKQLSADVIHVHINSYGGHVSEGFAIYNMLKNHPATVKTYCDGFACSAASVIFMAGDERYMNEASALMIHGVQSAACGSAEELRKEADVADMLTEASANAYRAHVNIPDEQLDSMLSTVTWINAQEAVEMGFATAILPQNAPNKPKQSALPVLMRLIGEITNTQDRKLYDEKNTDEQEEPETTKLEEPEENKLLKFLTALGAERKPNEKS